MGSKGSQQVQTNQAQTYTPNPFAANALTAALGQAYNVAQTPFSTPVAPVAGFSPQQQQAFDITGATQGYAQPYIQQGAQYLGPQGASQFFNPFAANVTANLQDIFGQQMSQATGNATQQAGGTGADRIAVAQAELAKQQGLAAGQTYANMYGQAQQAAQTAGFGTAQLGVAGQNAALQGAQALLGTGSLQQQLAQAQLNAPYQQQLASIAWPYQNAQFLASITGALAPGLGGTTTGAGATTYPPASPLGTIAGLGMLGLGGYGLYNKMGGSGGTAEQAMVDTGSQESWAGARGGRVANPFASGGGVDDEPIDIAPASLIPQSQLAPIQVHMPQLPQPQQQSAGGGKGSGLGDVATIMGSVAKIAPLLLAQRGGRIRNPFADGGFFTKAPRALTISGSK